MAGPDAIVAVMVFTQQAYSPVRTTAVVAGVPVTFVTLYVAMRFATVVQKVWVRTELSLSPASQGCCYPRLQCR